MDLYKTPNAGTAVFSSILLSAVRDSVPWMQFLWNDFIMTKFKQIVFNIGLTYVNISSFTMYINCIVGTIAVIPILYFIRVLFFITQTFNLRQVYLISVFFFREIFYDACQQTLIVGTCVFTVSCRSCSSHNVHPV